MSKIPRIIPLPSPYSFNCPNFINEKGEKETVVAVIVPVSFKSVNIFDWSISYACNLQRHCHYTYCIYALGGKR